MSIVFNPAGGTWQQTESVPTAAQRSGDYSGYMSSQGVSVPILDFANNNRPFPGNVIPQSRLDPVASQAVSAVPLPNYSGPIANVNFMAQGTIPANGHFVIDGSTNSNLATFGGLVLASVPGANGQTLRRSACSLTVDGVLAASSLTTFQ